MTFSIFGDEFGRSIRESREQARRSPKGMGVEQLVPDAIVTHSASKHTGDRSGIEGIYKVIASNGGHVLLEVAHPGLCQKIGERRIIVISEHEWYPAEHLLDELKSGSGAA